MARWARRYQLPIALTAVFFIVLFSLMLVSTGRSGPGAKAPPASAGARAAPPVHSPCPVCGIARRCNSFTGQCELEQATPPSCVKGAHYDARAGFCVPVATPRPTSLRSATLRPAPPRATGPPSPAGGTPSPGGGPTPSVPPATATAQP